MQQPPCQFAEFTTIIIPVFNEGRFAILAHNLQIVSAVSNCEILCIDGGSNDGTERLLDSYANNSPEKIKIQTLLKSTRAARIKEGLRLSRGQVVVILHPRTKIFTENLRELIGQSSSFGEVFWGAWRHSFDYQNPILGFTSWYSNFCRGRISSIFYLDHCVFFKLNRESGNRQHLIEDIPVFEDTLLSRRLTQRCGRGRLLKTKTQTSAFRFIKNGSLRQSLLNQAAKLLYLLGVSPQRIYRIYEKGLWLN